MGLGRRTLGLLGGELLTIWGLHMVQFVSLKQLVPYCKQSTNLSLFWNCPCRLSSHYILNLYRLLNLFRSEDMSDGPISLLVRKGVEVRVKPVGLIVNRSDEKEASHTPGRFWREDTLSVIPPC